MITVISHLTLSINKKNKIVCQVKVWHNLSHFPMYNHKETKENILKFTDQADNQQVFIINLIILKLNMKIKVNEIFHSIQGESLHAGRPCTFIRLSGCNLRCRFCDTRYAYKEGLLLTKDHILKKIAKIGCRLVEITGGEPLFQPDTPELITNLLDEGYETMMETNGSFDIDYVDSRCIKIVDIKCPSSGESRKNRLENIKKLGQKDQIKFVIADIEDYEFAKKIIKTQCTGIKSSHILFSPVHEMLEPEILSKWILKDGQDVRLQLQLHKIIWPDIERGV